MQNIEEICSSQQKEQELDRLNVSSETKCHSKKEKVENMKKIKEVLGTEAQAVENLQEQNALTKSNLQASLDENHKEELRKSGISDETIFKYTKECLLKSIKAVEKAVDLRISKNVNGPALLFNYPDCDYHTCKLDNPRTDEKGKVLKYECPVNEQPQIFRPLGFDINAEVIIITEGIKKAMKAQQEGYNTISGGGVWSWKSKKTEDGINKYFKQFAEELVTAGKKVVYLCFDNDISEKDSVKLAFKHLSLYLLSQGIVTLEIKLPYNKGQKLGLDDYLMLENADLDKLIAKAKISYEILFEYAIKGKKIGMGKTFNLECANIHISIKELYKAIPTGLYVLNKETYDFSYCIKNKKFEMGVLTKKTNFALELVNETITITQSITPIELFNREVVIISPKQKTKRVIIDQAEVTTVVMLLGVLKFLGHYLTAFKDSEISGYLNQVFENPKAPELYISNNPGFNIIDGNEIWLAENQVTKYKDNSGRTLPQIKLADSLKNNTNKIANTELIAKDEKFAEYVAEAKTHFGVDAKLSVQEAVGLAFVYSLYKAYNEAIEPFVIIGLAFMSIFVTHIAQKFKGFPLGYLEGQTATGKSNLLSLIANLYGFESSYPRSGNDTPKNILFNLQQNASIPMLLNEIGDSLRPRLNEWVIKPVFDRTPRRVMKRSGEEERGTAINSTLIFNTNAPIHKEPAIVNRILHTYWEKGIFNVAEAKRFNPFVDYLSILIPHVVETVGICELMTKIQSWVDSDSLKCISDTRHKVNLAIALTGLDIFLGVVNQSQLVNLNIFGSKIETYLSNYEKKAVDDEFEKMLFATRIALFGTHSLLKVGTDYKEVMCSGRKGLHIDTGKNGEAFRSQVVNSYNANYRNSFSLRFIDYERLLNENGVKKEKATYGEGSKYGFFFPFDEFDNIELWSKEYNQGVRFINEADNATSVSKVGTEIF